MSSAPAIRCPKATLATNAQGVLRVTVLDDSAQLIVRFARDVTNPPQPLLLRATSYTLTGGERIFPRILSASVHNTGVPTALQNRLILLQLDRIGDFSTYTLTVSDADLDPFFSSIKLRFRLACDASFDCRPPLEADEQPREPDVVVDYLTRDYASFRQALLELVPTRLAAWTERSEADIGIMILELLAATGDTLSYTQDRIASEAFLSTARQRRSVAGHLALVGYELDEGASALTFLRFKVNAVHTVVPGLRVSTRKERESDAVVVFETLAPVTLRPEHNVDQMRLFKWGKDDCCLLKGSLTADLDGEFPHLEAGAWLLFADDAGHGDVVRIAERELVPATPGEVVPSGPRTIVRWLATTPLRTEYCVSKTTVSANVIPATHGETIVDDLRAIAAATRLRYRLNLGPLAFLDPRVLVLTQPVGTPVDERSPHSVSTLSLTIGGDVWEPRRSLLESSENDRHFRIEVDDDGDASIVTGNGVLGQLPGATASARAIYRIGGGTAGNIAAMTLTEAHAGPSESLTWLDEVTNPLPATGGRDRESRDRARRFAPATFHDPLVAVTAADYERAAAAVVDTTGAALIQRATATFRWTGSWLTVTTAIDPRGSSGASAEVIAAATRALDARRLAGYDLEILSARYLPLDVIVDFCAAPRFNAADVQRRLIAALAGGANAFFNADNFSFGDDVFASRLFAAAMSVAGVESARIRRLALLHAANPNADTARNLQQGFLAVGGDQVILLDNDRNHPERGALQVVPAGRGA